MEEKKQTENDIQKPEAAEETAAPKAESAAAEPEAGKEACEEAKTDAAAKEEPAVNGGPYAGDEAAAETNKQSESNGKTEPKKKSRRTFIGGIAIGAAVIIAAECIAAGIVSADGINYVKLIPKMALIESYIDSQYLYEADGDDITDGIFQGMLYGLKEDDYAQYYGIEAEAEVTEHLNGNYVGIGVTVQKDAETGGLYVVSVNEGSPAEEAGIMAGDILIESNGVDLTELSVDDGVSNVSGEEGTSAEIKLLRNGEEITVTAVRKTIDVKTVFSKVIESSEVNDNKGMGGLRIGYIGLKEFLRNSDQQFIEAVDELVDMEEVSGLIIDLRNNGGGDVSACLNMLDRILSDDLEVSDAKDNEDDADEEEDGTLLLQYENKYGEKSSFYASDGEGVEIPVVVLVNENSASSSEIFAGAMKSYGYQVLGEKTYGKGIVQTDFTLKDGTGFKFTTDQYVLPNGDNIHKVGIEPTMELAFTETETLKKSQLNNYTGREDADLMEDNQISAAADEIAAEAYEAYQNQ